MRKNLDATALLGLAIALISTVAQAQMHTVNGHLAAPDDWLVNAGQPWHYRAEASKNSSQLGQRPPTADEGNVIERARSLFARTSAKAMALVHGRDIVWMDFKPPIKPESPIFGYSMGKTVTAMAVGKAICARKLTMETRLSTHVPELADTDLGQASVRDLLTMRSGTWEGNPDSTIWTAEEARAIANGQMNWLQLLSVKRVSSAVSFLGTKRTPGERFAYRSTDPLALGILLSRVTGKSYAAWVDEEVLKPIGVAGPVSIAQDRASGYGQADGAIRMQFADWIRFATWVRNAESEPGCFGDFVREAVKPHTATNRAGSLQKSYGYLTWVQDDVNWAMGYGGQRIGWNRRNDRMIVVFSSVEDYMGELHQFYQEWAKLP